MASAGGISSPRARGTGSAPIAIGGRDPPPIFFSSCRKENGPWTVQKKRALLANREGLDLSTKFPAAFAETSLLPAPGPAPSAPLGATSSTQVTHRSFRRKRQNSLVPLRLLSPPDPLRWAPAGAPKQRVGIVLPLRLFPGLPLRFVGISFTSLVSPQAAKLTRSTMPPLPTKSPILRGPQKMQ